MLIQKETLPIAAKKSTYSAFEATKLIAAQKSIHVFAVVASVCNFLFLVCDLIFIHGLAERLIAGVLRYTFSIVLILMIRKLQRIHTFASFAAVVSILETIGVALFFIILFLYNAPDFMIQSMGMIMTILVIFIVPNRNRNMMVLSIASCVAFYVIWYFFLKNINQNDFIAAAVYSVLTIIICAMKAFRTDRFAQNEFETISRLEYTSTRDYLTNAITRERLEEEARRWMNFCRSRSCRYAWSLWTWMI
ncbi:MAG: hypothetical protein C0413_04290 [Clostridiales bacterium]|nr:hypothetical protein [Clostridiales bacterium]